MPGAPRRWVALTQPLDQIRQHVPQPVAGPEPHRDDQRDHQPGGQQPTPQLLGTGRGDYFVEHLVRERSLDRIQQGLITQVGRQGIRVQRETLQRHDRPASVRLEESGSCHTLYPLSERYWT
jgi:hypothetical protein